MRHKNRMDGERVIVIGGTSGIGLAVAKAVSEEGASVVVASHKQANLNKALAVLPRNAEARALDVTDEPSIRSFFKEIGPFDHLVFTAGEALQMKPLAQLTIDEARSFFNIRYWGAFMAIKYGVANVRRGGSIVTTSGSVAVHPMPGLIAAASITAAVESMTRTLALELAPQAIRANVVRPGPVRTSLWEESVPNAEEVYKSFAKEMPVARVGEPDEVAQAYLYLMKNGFTTGAVLAVDGGHALA